MEKKLKLIWDFYGPDAIPTAKHHAIHLKQYAEKENLQNSISEFVEVEPEYAVAYLVVVESEMLRLFHIVANGM
ncbi:MAG: hypothetical protein RSD53_04680 [Algoriella sp.]